jgi:hypothetical protein
VLLAGLRLLQGNLRPPDPDLHSDTDADQHPHEHADFHTHANANQDPDRDLHPAPESLYARRLLGIGMQHLLRDDRGRCRLRLVDRL